MKVSSKNKVDVSSDNAHPSSQVNSPVMFNGFHDGEDVNFSAIHAEEGASTKESCDSCAQTTSASEAVDDNGLTADQ